MKTLPPSPHLLARFVKLWPGLIAALSLLAVWGNQTPHQDGQRTLMTAGQAALPELRAMPAPTPGPSLLATPQEELTVDAPSYQRTALLLGQAQLEPRMPDLTALGRQQTDGG